MGQKMLSQMETSTFCGHMAVLLRSGIPADRAVALFAEDTPGAAGKTAAAMLEAMDAGSGFAEAAAAAGGFPDYALGVFRMAERSGRLDEALERLAAFYERQNALTLRLRNTLTYPVALLLMMCGVLAVLVFQVLPMFERVYESLTGNLAVSSYAYVIAAAAISRISLILAGCVSIALLALAVALRFPGGREKLRGPMERSVLTKNASWLLAVSTLTDTLATLLASGTDPDSAMEQALEMTVHTRLKAALTDCLEKQRRGESMAMALYSSGVIRGLYGRVLLGGAESGNLENTMSELSYRMGREAEEALSGLIDRIEPVLIGFLTVSVGLTLVSVMLPLLGILGAV